MQFWWNFVLFLVYLQIGPSIIVWGEAYFNSRDGNENFFLSISCSRREFLSLNLVLQDENENFFFQPQASRQERESSFETILARIFGNYICCLFFDWYFHKKAANFSKFLKIICLFFWRNLNGNLFFRDENGNTFLSISCIETRTRNRKWFLKVQREKIKLILTEIPVTLCLV